jgi:hypothetical protein
MTGGTIRVIGARGDTEVVQDVFLPQTLLVIGIQKFPLPVLGIVQLLGRFGMA